MGIRTVAISAAIALAGTLGAGAARAHAVDVQWSITIGSPVQVRPVPVHVQTVPVQVRHVPVRVQPRPAHHVHRGGGHAAPRFHRTRWDRDGIPDRRDRRSHRHGG